MQELGDQRGEGLIFGRIYGICLLVILTIFAFTSALNICVADPLYRKTQVGNIEVTDIRPPRFIGRDGVGYTHCYSGFLPLA